VTERGANVDVHRAIVRTIAPAERPLSPIGDGGAPAGRDAMTMGHGVRRLGLAAFFCVAVVAGGVARADEEEATPPPAASHAPAEESANAPHEGAAPSASAHGEKTGEGHAAEGESKPAAAAPETAGSSAGAAAIPPPSDNGDLSAADEREGDRIAALHDPAKYGEWLRLIVEKVKEHVLDKTIAKIEEKQAAKMATLSTILFGVSLSGFLLLLLPLALAKKYPGKGGVLFKFSAIAAFSAVFVLNLFAGVVFLLRSVQSETAKLTDPQVHVLTAAFDAIANDAEHLVEMGPQLIQPTLDQVSASDDPMPTVLLDNVKTIAKDAEPFVAAGQWFKDVTWIFEYVPFVMTCVTIVLFLLGARPILAELMKLPGRAAAGEDTRGVVRTALKFVGNELLATLCLIGALIVVTMVSAETVSLAVTPAVGTFLDTFFADVVYVQTPHASSGLIFGSLAGTIVFLALNVLILLVANSAFLGKFHKIFQAKFQQKVPLSAHKKFWIWGVLSLVWLQLFPMLFMRAADPLLEKIVEKGFAKEEANWSFILSATPLVLVGGFLFLLWAVRGLKALIWLFKYKPQAVAASESTEPTAAPAAG
jgi:hypothetical protein